MSWPNHMSYGQPVLLVQAPPNADQLMRIPKNGEGMSIRKIKKTIAFLKELEEAKKKDGKDKDKKEDDKKDKMNPLQAFALLTFVGPPLALVWLTLMISSAHYVVEHLHNLLK